MRLSLATLLVGSLLVSETALALDFTWNVSRYSDAAMLSVSEVAAVSMLTNLGVVAGNADGTFAPRRPLNRAEFLAIAYARGKTVARHDSPTFRCFPDVPVSLWYGPVVCTAKDAAIIQGYPDGRFHPDGNVILAEAIKMLVGSFPNGQLERQPGDAWFAPYVRNAQQRGLLLPETLPMDHQLTRGEMARLTAGFYAESHDELPLYRRAEKGEVVLGSSLSSSAASSQSSHTSSAPAASSASSVRSASSTSSSSSAVGQRDPLTDTAARSQFLLLDETSPILGVFKAFMDLEPLDVTSVTVHINTAVTGIDSFLIYDEDRNLIGRARADSATSYVLTIPHKTVIIDKRVEKKFYVRASLLSKHQGAVSDATIAISSIVVKGDGVWSSDPYSVASTDVFPAFKTSRSVITSITNVGMAQEALVGGPQRTLGRFTLQGRRTDGTAIIKVTDLRLDIGQTGGVTVTNVRLGADGIDFQHPCTVAATTIVCTNIPAGYLSLEDGARTITVYGDIAVPNGAASASLRLSINLPGSIATDGAVTWTDGSGAFSWVPFNSPVADGTLYKM